MAPVSATSAPRPLPATLKRPMAAPEAVAQVARPVAPQAAAQAPKGLRFDSIEAYKAHVRTTEVTQLPALRRAVVGEQAKVATAREALGRAEGVQGLKGKQEALAAAERGLEAAKFPFRPQAEAKRAEAARVAGEAGQVAADIARQQNAIVAAKTRSAVRDDRIVRDTWNDKPYSGWDAAFDIAGSLSNSAAARQAQRQIEVLVQRKAGLEAQVMNLQAEATALQFQPGEAAPVAEAQGKRDAAKQKLAQAELQLIPQREALAAAEAGLKKAQGEMIRVDGVKAELTQYDEIFSWSNRTKWSLSGTGWKKDLENFWKAY